MTTSRLTRTLPLPSDPSVSVTIRALSWLQTRAARQAALKQSVDDLKGLGGPAFLKDLSSALGIGKAESTEDASALEADPLATHDPITVLVSGLQTWTKPEPLTREVIEDFEEVDVEGLARAILALKRSAVGLEEPEKNA
jgi:hypothetical protein